MAGNGRRSGGGRKRSGTMSARGTAAGRRMAGRTNRFVNSDKAFKAWNSTRLS